MSTEIDHPKSAAALRRWPRLIAVVMALALVAAACGDDDDDATSSTPDSTEQDAPQATLADAPDEGPTALGQLDFLGFEGDDLLDFTADFREAAGIDLRSSYVNAEAEAEAQILSGASGGVDIISFTSTASPEFQEAGILQPIDRSLVPNLDIMLPFFEEVAPEVFQNEDGELVCIPAYWGAIGIAYNTMVTSDLSAWSDLLDPEWTGRLATIDFPNPIFYVAAVANGIDPSHMSENDLRTLVDWLTPYMAQMKTFSPGFGDLITLLASNEVDAVMPGFNFLVGGAAAGGNENIALNINPAEGAPILVSCHGIASTADNLDAAYAWLNHMLDPEVSAANAELQGGIATVEPAIDLISDDLRAKYPYDDLAAYLASSDIITDWPVSSDEFVDADDIATAWAELKTQAPG